LTLAYGIFGERSEGGYPVDRRGQEFHSLLRAYLSERESVVQSTWRTCEQIHNMDQFRGLMDLATKRIMETESALVMMGEQKTQLQDKIRIVEGPLKMGEKILHDDI
jgi:hypothetical protein